MDSGDDDEMGYRIWLRQLKKVLRNRDVVFNEVSLLKNDCASKRDHKGVKFQHVQPQGNFYMNPQDAPCLAGNNNEPVVIELDDVGQQIDAPDGHIQPPIHAKNRARTRLEMMYSSPLTMKMSLCLLT